MPAVVPVVLLLSVDFFQACSGCNFVHPDEPVYRDTEIVRQSRQKGDIRIAIAAYRTERIQMSGIPQACKLFLYGESLLSFFLSRIYPVPIDKTSKS